MKLFIILSCFLAVVSSQCTANSKCAGSNGKCATCSFQCEPGPACCGNGVCEAFESCSTCPEDCGSCPSCTNACGNGLCDLNESGCNCPQDCGPCCCDGKCSGPETWELCPGECGGALRLKTIDSVTGAPVALANVTCYSQNQVSSVSNQLTDSQGDLVVGFLEPNSYTCTAVAAGYASNSASHVVTPAGKVFIPTVIPLVRAPLGCVTGVVRHSSSKGWLRGASVVCSRAGGRTYDFITSGKGTFHLKDVQDGAYACVASLAGFDSVTINVAIQRGSNPFLTFSLAPRPAALTLTTLDYASRGALANVTVSCVECLTGRTLGSSVSDSNGQVSFTGISAERGSNAFTCTATANNRFTAVQRVELKRAKTVSATIALRKM